MCLPAAGVPKPTSATAGDDPRQARSTGRGQMRSRRVVCGMCTTRKELTNVTILCTRDKQAMLFRVCNCIRINVCIQINARMAVAYHTAVTCSPPSTFTSTSQVRHNDRPWNIDSRQPTTQMKKAASRFAAETSHPSSRCQVSRTTPSIHTRISTSASRISHQHRPAPYQHCP